MKISEIKLMLEDVSELKKELDEAESRVYDLEGDIDTLERDIKKVIRSGLDKMDGIVDEIEKQIIDSKLLTKTEFDYILLTLPESKYPFGTQGCKFNYFLDDDIIVITLEKEGVKHVYKFSNEFFKSKTWKNEVRSYWNDILLQYKFNF